MVLEIIQYFLYPPPVNYSISDDSNRIQILIYGSMIICYHYFYCIQQNCQFQKRRDWPDLLLYPLQVDYLAFRHISSSRAMVWIFQPSYVIEVIVLFGSCVLVFRPPEVPFNGVVKPLTHQNPYRGAAYSGLFTLRDQHASDYSKQKG